MSNLIGTNANQVPTCGMLGTLAFMDMANPTTPRVEVTTDTTLDATHSGKLIIMTSASQRTITLPLSSDMPAGWFCYLQNKSTGSDYHLITKNAGDTYAECSDGVYTWSNYAFYPEEVRMVMKDTAGFKSIVLKSFYVTILSSVSFSRPPGYSAFAGMIWGGGGSGGRSGTGGYYGGGGGGGACTPFYIPKATFGGSQSITIGAGGAARTGAQAGDVGGTSTLGSMYGAYGGGGGGVGISGNAYACGGGGGGSWSAGTTGVYKPSTEFSINGGLPGIASSGDGTSTDLTILHGQGFGGARGTVSYPGVAAYGGGGGASSGAGGSSVFGGGGGGGSSFGGSSPGGGAGGMGSVSSSASPGSVPAGGGGGTQTGATSGAGANGQCIIYGVL